MKRLVHYQIETDQSASKVDIEGMSRVGLISMRGTDYEIYINTDDPGKIPHFHVRNKDDWSAFHTCIQITEASYFKHGNKTDSLNTKEKKALQQFMIAPSKHKFFREDGTRMNNWESICELWNMNNSDVIIEEDAIQPDYTELD